MIICWVCKVKSEKMGIHNYLNISISHSWKTARPTKQDGVVKYRTIKAHWQTRHVSMGRESSFRAAPDMTPKREAKLFTWSALTAVSAFLACRQEEIAFRYQRESFTTQVMRR